MNAVRIGFCTDLSGPYESVDGHAGARAIALAIEDAAADGVAAELVTADHRNDVDEAARIARHWLDDDAVDVIIGGVNSDTSLAMSAVAAERERPMLVVGAGTAVQTRERSSRWIVQWAYDTAALARVPGLVLTRQGRDAWFFVTADYPFGRELESFGADAVVSAGGTVLGSALASHDDPDLRPALREARESGASVIAFAAGQGALVTGISQAEELGIDPAVARVGLLTFLDDIRETGLERAQGLYLPDSWYWTRDAASRDWAARFGTATGRMPSSLHAADYSAALQYLRAAAVVGASPAAVMERLRTSTFDDVYVQGGRIREDGTMLHELHLLRVRAPGGSDDPWDVYEPVATVPAAEAFPLA